MSDHPDLAALMRRARQGDDAAYRQLLVRVALWLRPVVRRGLTMAGRGPHDAEDIVQETLLAMHLKRETWDDTQPIEPWLRAIARYKLVDHLRRRGVREAVDIDDCAELAAPGPAEPGLALDSRKLLAGLPERQQRIVVEIAIEGRRAAEVASRLGMTEGAVRVALHRALRALAAAFRQERP